MGAHELGQELQRQALEALDDFEAIAERDDVKLTFTLEPGEVVVFNN
jgi:hypothetical protein